VDNRALQEAANRLIQELGRIPEIAHNLAQAGAQLHIIGDHQDPTDLPYLRWWKGRPYDGQLTMDERTRGVGGLIASCGEENLLRLDSDPYVEHRDICMHEFAHTIQDHAMPRDVRQMVKDQFRKSTDKGLWKNMYAASNSGEFFAELTMWYFGTRGDTGRLGNIKPPSTEGPEWLKSYDPEAYDLLDRFYSGKIPIAKSEFINLPAHPKEEESQLRSGADENETQIQFDNTTDNKYSLFWIDAEGKRNPYESVEPHAKNTQSTFAGHVWLVADPEGNTVALYIAEEKPGVAVLK
jgi:hypothetical protein